MIEQGGRGGVADYTAALVAALAAQGTAVDLATARDHRYPEARGVTVHRSFRYLRDDAPVGRALRRAHLGRVGNGLLFLAAIPRLVAIARGADIVHTQGWEDLRLGVVAVAALRVSGATVVQTEHNTFERATSLERTRRTLARLTARTIVHAQADVPRAYASERGHAVVIPHGEYGGLARTGGDGDRAGARAALGIPDGAPAVLLFGQLRADKGPRRPAARRPRRARAARDHRRRGSRRAGGRGRATRGARASRPCPPAGRVRADGRCRRPLRCCRCRGPSIPARKPSGVLLAYGFSRAVVAYPVGGLAEAVQDGETGWLCARPDPEALADALRAVVAAGPQECARRGVAGRRLAETRCLGRDCPAHARGLRRRAGPGRRRRATDRADRLRSRAGVRRGDRRGDHHARGSGCAADRAGPVRAGAARPADPPSPGRLGLRLRCGALARHAA